MTNNYIVHSAKTWELYLDHTMSDIFQKELNKSSAPYPWDAATMSISDIMDGQQLSMIHDHHAKTGIGIANPNLNLILQLIRFFTLVTDKTPETRILYCGSHAYLVEDVLKYFPTFHLTICSATELVDPEQYAGWILIYDYQVNYKDVLIECLAKRGLLLTDDAGGYATSYRQAIDEAMRVHREAVAELLKQHQKVNRVIRPVMGLWRFTLPRNSIDNNFKHHDQYFPGEMQLPQTNTNNEVVGIDGEIWPSIWGAANTNYAWMVTDNSKFSSIGGGGVTVKVYRTDVFHGVLRYYNITLRSKFYQNPVTGDSQPPKYPELNNSWDSWATADVLEMLDETDAKEVLLRWFHKGTNTATDINDPFF